MPYIVEKGFLSIYGSKFQACNAKDNTYTANNWNCPAKAQSAAQRSYKVN